MQTNSSEAKHTHKATRNPLPPAIGTYTEPRPGSRLASLPNPSTQPATRERSRQDLVSELDATLAGDPNTGAMQGVRFALLFNAGLALSGVVIWELWTMLAH
jgi:hypothetical protein